MNANAGEKLYANDQRLTFSAATPTNKFLYLGISDENLGVILAGQSRTNGEEIAAVGYINPLLLEAGSDIKESLPGVLHSYLDATKPDTRVVAILGGRYPLRGFRRGNFGLRNRYRNTLSSFNRLVEDTLDLSPEVIIGPTPYGSRTQAFYITEERRVIIIREEVPAKLNKAFHARDVLLREAMWRSLMDYLHF